MTVEYIPFAGVIAAITAFFLSVKFAVKAHHDSKVISRSLIKDNYVRNHNLERKVANEAIFRLSSYAQKINPDFIVGVNRGGTMVGAFISLGLGISSKNFISCLVSRKEGHKVTCDIKNARGIVLVIDDVSRSGNTLEEAVREIRKKNKNIKEIYSAVLVTTIDKNGGSNYQELDYFSYAITDRNVHLPWSPKNKNKPEHESYRVKKYKKIRRRPLDKIAVEITDSLYRPNKIN